MRTKGGSMADDDELDGSTTDKLDRRTFLKGAAAVALGPGLSGCGQSPPLEGGEGGSGGDGGGPPNDLGCIDVHTHAIPIEPAATTPEAGRSFAQELVRRMDPAQVDEVILLAVTERLLWGLASIADDTRWRLADLPRQNDLCLAAHDEHPDRIEVYIGLDWQGFADDGWTARAVAQVEDAIGSRGASGIKFHLGQATTVLHLNRNLGLADDHQFLTDERLAPVLSRLWELGGLPLIHVGDTPSASYPADAPPFWDLDAATYQHMEQLLNTFAGRPFILAHLACLAPDLNPYRDTPGAPTDYTGLRTLLDAHPNLYVDTAGINIVPGRVGLSEEGATATRQLILDYPDRILFGTDFGPAQKEFPAYEIYHQWLTGPLGQTFRSSYYPELDIWSLGLEGEVLHQLYRGNYEQLRTRR